MSLTACLQQYLDGAITLAEFLGVLVADYMERQAASASTCLTCGSDLSKRLED